MILLATFIGINLLYRKYSNCADFVNKTVHKVCGVPPDSIAQHTKYAKGEDTDFQDFRVKAGRGLKPRPCWIAEGQTSPAK
ncbi:MAG: hypothetical protein LBO67_09695 [Spirochaetaceae bacterium]|nr:hypothetical protein [Spirochaetaceae bacterium]